MGLVGIGVGNPHPMMAEKKKSLSLYSNTVDKFLSFYYNAMSNAPHPHLVADEIIQAIANSSNSENWSNSIENCCWKGFQRIFKAQKGVI